MRITFDIPSQMETWRSLVRLPRWVVSGWRWWRSTQALTEHLRAVRALDVAPNARVGELCFGAGMALADLLAAVPEGQVVAVDPSGEMVRMAQHTFRPWVESGQLRLVCGSPWSAPLEDGALDAVLINDGLQMWPDLVAGFTEVSRLLGPAGRMVLSLNNVVAVEQAVEIMRDLGFAVAIDEAHGGSLLIASRL